VKGEAPGDRWFAERREESVDPIPKEHRLAVSDEIRPAGHGIRVTFWVKRVLWVCDESPLGEEVGVRGVLDVDHVHFILAVAHDAQAAGAGAGEDARNEVRVTDPPDQMRSEGDGAKGGRIGGEDFAFGDGFGERIRAGAIGGERQGFIRIGEGLAVIDHARSAGVDKAADAVSAGTVEERAGAENVGLEEFLVGAPDADFGGDVKNGIDAGASGGDGAGVVERRADETDAASFKVGCGGAAEDGDGAAGSDQALDEMAAEEAGAAGDKSGGIAHGRHGIHGTDGKPERTESQKMVLLVGVALVAFGGASPRRQRKAMDLGVVADVDGEFGVEKKAGDGGGVGRGQSEFAQFTGEGMGFG
jgi:hypothetical protein